MSAILYPPQNPTTTHLSQPTGPSSSLEAWPMRPHQISGCQGAGDVSCHRNAKAAEKNIGADRWCEEANIRLDRGATAQSGGQKSFCLDKPGKPNADELVRKGLATRDIQSVSRRLHAPSAKSSTFRAAKLPCSTCRHRHYQILQVFSVTFAGCFSNLA